MLPPATHAASDHAVAHQPNDLLATEKYFVSIGAGDRERAPGNRGEARLYGVELSREAQVVAQDSLLLAGVEERASVEGTGGGVCWGSGGADRQRRDKDVPLERAHKNKDPGVAIGSRRG